MAIQPHETQIIGRWINTAEGVKGNEACERIDRLTQEHLIKLAKTDGGWTTLYRDPSDGRLWERTYPQSGLHGGGPPVLYQISEAEAQQKYGAAVPAPS